MYWFEKAAEQGNELSQGILDQIYEADRMHREEMERLAAATDRSSLGEDYDDEPGAWTRRFVCFFWFDVFVLARLIGCSLSLFKCWRVPFCLFF